jgi:hypothetical protein
MITDQDVDAFLEHHGVKGMHWGVRRKDRSNHGLNQRARKLQAVADRRPSRGNVRKAQRAQGFAVMTPEEKTFKRMKRRDTGLRVGKVAISVGVGIGSGVFVNQLVRKHADIHMARAAANVSAFAGSLITSHILDVNGQRKLRSMRRK